MQPPVPVYRVPAESRLAGSGKWRKPRSRKCRIPQTTENTDNGSCQRLVLAMTVIVSFIFGLCRNAHKNNDNNICNEIRQRMYRIRQHGGTVTYNTCKEFEDKQEKVYHTSHNRHPVNVFFPCGICFLFRVCISICFSSKVQPIFTLCANIVHKSITICRSFIIFNRMIIF